MSSISPLLFHRTIQGEKMNFLSLYRHLKVINTRVPLRKICHDKRHILVLFHIALFLALAGTLTGCYSFTGGSIPEHLKTLSIPLVDDASGFGNAQLRENLTQQLVQAFRRENAFRLVQENADATLEVRIANVNEITATVQQGEAERDKQVIVSVNVAYHDRVKQKLVWEKQFAPPQTYTIASGLQGRDAAIERALRQIATDILLAVVSGW
jgi:hypothetical protein